MTGLKKILFIVPAIIVVLGLVLLLTARFLPESDFVKQTIESKIAEVTGRQVSVGKVEIRFGFPSLVNAVVDTVSITDSDGKRLFSVREIQLNLGFWSILGGNPAIERLTISGASFVMYRDSSGNMDSILSMKHEKIPESAREPEPSSSESIERKEPGKGVGIDRQPGPAPEKRHFSWPIKYVLVESSEVIVQNTSAIVGEPLRTALENLNCQIIREGNTINFTLVATPSIPSVQSSDVAAKGLVRLNNDFTAVEIANVSMEVESAKVSDLSFLPVKVASWLNRLEIRKLDLKAKIEKDRLPHIDFSAGLFPNELGVTALSLTGSGELTDDFGQVEKIAFKGVSQEISLRQFGIGLIPEKFLNQIGIDGSVATQFGGSWTKSGGWAADGSAKLLNVKAPPEFRFLGNNLSTSISFEITSDSFSITDFKLQNESSENIFNFNGLINQPFSDARTIKVDSKLSLRGEWISKLGIKLPKDVMIQGPMLARIHAEGPLDSLQLGLNGDITGTGITWKSIVQKEAGVKAFVKASTRTPLNLLKLSTISKDSLDIGIKIDEAPVRLGSQIHDSPLCPLFLSANVSSSKGEFSLNDLQLRLSLPEKNAPLISIRGQVKGLNAKAPEMGFQGNLILTREVIGIAGKQGNFPVDVGGLSNLTFRISGSPHNFNWSLAAPLKNLTVSAGEWFQKKGGLELDISSSGSYSEEEIQIKQTRVKGPGILLSSSGIIGVGKTKTTSINLELSESELGSMLDLIPNLRHSGLSGPIRGTLAIASETKNQTKINGSIQLIGLNYRFQSSPLTLEKMNGVIHLTENYLEGKQIKGIIKGTVDAPFNASIKLSNLDNPANIRGQMTVQAGPGKLAAGRLRSLVTGTQAFIEPLLSQDKQNKNFNPFDLELLTADLQIDQGVIRTDNLKLKTSELSMGAIAKTTLKSRQFEAISYIRASTAPLAAIGSIPVIKDIIKKNEGLLKATGLDKELRKLGIEPSGQESTDPDGQPKTERTLNLIIRIAGPWTNPTISPVMESALPRDEALRLKNLLN